MDDLKSLVKCSYCNQTYKEAVDLPCKSVICQKDIYELQTDGNKQEENISSILCPFCKQIHQVPEENFPSNQFIEKLLKTQLNEFIEFISNDEERCETKRLCEMLNEKLDEVELMDQNRLMFVRKHFSSVRNQIDVRCELLKAQIDKLAEEKSNELDIFENECLKKINNRKNKSNSTDLSLDYRKFIDLETKKLDEWSNELNALKLDQQNLKKIQQEAEKSLKEVGARVKLLKNECLANKSIRFKASAVDVDDSLLGVFEVCSLVNQERYEGDFKNGKKNGFGSYYYSNGDKCEGFWKNGVRDGFGTYFWKNGNKYVGEWKDHMMNGKGVFYWNDKSIFHGDRYEGSFKMGKKHGKGVYFYSDGDEFEGVWVDDQRQECSIRKSKIKNL